MGTVREVEEINLVLDSLKSVHAPDTRVTWWEPEVTVVKDTIYLGGEVGDDRAYSEITGTLSNRYPEMKINLRLLPGAGKGQQVNGLVNVSVANIRSAPSHRSELSSQALLGSPVRLLKREGDWYLVQTPNRYLGWVDYAAVVETPHGILDSVKQLQKVVFIEQHGFSYMSPDDNALPAGDLVAGCILYLRHPGNLFHEVVYPDGKVAWVKTGEVRDAVELFDTESTGEDLAKRALRYNGVPYLWGGTSAKALDCSGFSSVVYFMNGTMLMRDANQQSWHGLAVTTEYNSASLLPGDLLFYGRKATSTEKEQVSHVAIYLGNDGFIHASGTLGRVGISSMDSTMENYLPEYREIFVRAIRIVGQEDTGFHPVSENPFYKEIL